MAKIQIKNSFITSSAQITISSSLVRFSDNIRAKGITGSFSGSFAGSNLFVQGGNSFGTTALLGTNDNQPLVLETNASEKMRVTAAGLVGIGTSNPGTKLQVLGDATVGTPGSGGNLWILGDRDWRFIAGTTGYGVGSGFGLFDNTGGAYRIAVDPNGNIGIGTTSPSTPLHVFNTAATLATFTRDLATDVGFSIGADSNGTIFSTAGAHAYLFYTNGTEKMRIASDGNVGIGVSNPAARLTISGSGTGRILMGNAGFGSGNYSGISLNGTLSTTSYNLLSSPSDTSLYINRPSGASMFFRMANNDQMKLDGNGYLGIGTTSPSQVLHVVGNVKLNSVFGEASTTGVTAITHTTDSTQPSMYLWGKDHATYPGQVHIIGRSDNASADAGKIAFYDYNGSGWDLNMVINKGGNVGIGTTSPGGKIDIVTGGANLTSYDYGLDLKLTTSGGWARGNRIYNTNYTAGTTFFGVLGGASSVDYAYWTYGNPASIDVTGYNTTTGIFLRPSGNVGVGTYSPASQAGFNKVFEVYDGTSVDIQVNSGNTYKADFGISSAGGWLGTTTTHPMRFASNGSERMRIDANGNVGIGTTSPTAKLYVINTERMLGILRVQSTPRTTFYDDTFAVNNDGGGANGFIYTSGTGGTFPLDYYGELILQAGPRTGYNNGISLVTGTTSPSVKVRVAENGNVGIGTTNPGYKLDVVSGSMRVSSAAGAGEIYFGTIDNANLYLKRDNNYDLSLVQNASSGNALYLAGAGNVYVSIDSNNNETDRAFIVQNNSVKSGTELFRVNEAGNVGIGSSSPTATLDVNGSIHLNGNIRDVWNDNIWNVGQYPYNYSTSPTYYMGFQVETATRIFYISNKNNDGSATDPNGGIIFRTGGTPTNRMIVSYSGNVGIGTSNPVALLDVRGNTKFGSSLSNTHQFTGSVNFGGSTYNNSIAIDKFEYFSLQPYIEGGSFPSNVFSLSGTFPTFVTMTGSACPFGKVAYNVSYYEAIGDFIPVQAGETLYGEIWAYRSAGATGTAGVFYCGIARYDKDKRAIDGNAGLNYFIVSAATVPSNSTWTKYSNTTTLPLTHTPYAGSDGGPVRYVRPYIIVNYTAGTVPTYWAAFKIRKQQLTRDSGTIFISGSVGIGVSTPAYPLHVRTSANTGTIAIGNVTYPGLISTNAGSGEFRIDNRTSAAAGYITFYPNGEAGSAGSEAMRIITNGNVGIGTSSPAYKLDVNTANDSAIRIRNGGGSANNGLSLSVGSGSPWLDITEGVEFRIKGNTYANIGTWNSGNNTKLLIDSNGNIGIGTTSPGGKLEVRTNAASNYVFSGTSTSGYTTTFTMDDTASYFGHDSGVRSLILRTNSTARLTVTGNGNVGIGTTSPAYKFELVGSGSVSIVNIAGRIRSNVGSDVYNTGTVLAFTNTTSNANAYAYIGSRIDAAAAGDNAQSLIFATNATNTLPTEKLRITSTGNVGIGSTAPAYKLDVSGAINLTGILSFNGVSVLNESTNANDIYANIRVIRNMSSTIQDGMYINYNSPGTTGAHLRFYANGTTERMRIDASSGNVGIGTSTVGAKLQVQGKGLIVQGITGTPYWNNNSFEIQSSGGNGVALEFHRAGYTSATMASMAGELSFYTDSGSERMRIVAGTGNVGIGTTNPTYKLHLSGSMLITGVGSGFSTPGSEAGYRLKFYDNGGVNNDTGIGLDGGGSGSEVMWFNALQGFYWNIGTGGEKMRLTSVGNLGIGTSVPSATLTVIATNNTGSRIQLGTASNSAYMDANKVNDFMVMTAPFGASPASVSNGGAKWGIKLNGSVDTINTKAKSAAIYAVSEENSAGYNRMVGLALHTSGFDLENSEKVRIKNDGNVGIGSTAPVYKLDVNGGIASGGVLVALYSGNYNRLYEPAGNPGIYLGNNSDPANYYDNTTHYFRNRGGSSNYAIINSNGNLGIGTSSPVQKLHVVGAVYGTTYGQFGTSVASGTNSSYAVFGSNSAVVGVKINIDSNVNRNDLVVSGSTGNVGIGTSQVLSKLNAYASGSNLSVFRVDGGNGTLFEVTDQLSGSLFSVNDVSGLPLLEVFSNNRVVAGKYGSNALVVSGSSIGIGTSRPSSRLQLGNLTSTQTSATETLSLGGTFSNSAGANVKLRVYEDGSGGAIGGMSVSSGQMEVNTWSAGKIAFYRGTTQTAIIDASGNVGIGSTAPIAKLDINGTTNFAANVYHSIGGQKFFAGSGGAYSYIYTGTTALNFINGGDTSTLMTILNGGSVGIGTTSPGSKLDVNGTFRTAINNLTIFNDYIYVSPTENNTLNSAYFTNGIADMWINYAGYNNGNTQFRNFNVGNGKNSVIAWFDGTNKRMSINNGQAASYTLDVNGSIRTTSKFVQNSTTVSVSGTGQTLTLNLDTAAVYVVSMASGATITTISYTNRDNNPSVNTIMLVVKYAGSASITFTNVIWANGVAPTLTGTNGYADVFMLTSYQGGAGTPVWIGTVVSQALVSTNL